MLCRYELKDPRKCLKEGKDVTKCALEGLQDIKKHCRNEFEAHVNCVIETSATGSNDQQYVYNITNLLSFVLIYINYKFL